MSSLVTDRQRRTAELLERMGMATQQQQDKKSISSNFASSIRNSPSTTNSSDSSPATGQSYAEPEVGEYPRQQHVEPTHQEQKSTEPYYQKLYNDHARHQERIQRARDKINAQERANAPTFTPRLNSDKEVERVLPGEGDLSQRLETWRKRRNERRIEAQNKIIQEQESLMRKTPEINAYSHELADELIADGKRHPDVSEHLYSLAPEFDKKVEWMKAQQMAAEVPATPAITRMAMSLEREGPVGNRLYEAALETRAKLNKQREDAEKLKELNAARGRPSQLTKEKQRTKVMGHSLYDRAVNERKKKDSMRKNKQKEIEEQQNQKYILDTSEKLMKGREAPLVRLSKMTPTQKRELQIWKIRRDLDAEQLRDARDLPHQKGSGFHLSDLNDEELTFQPAVNPISAQIAAVRNTLSGLTDVGDRLHAESKTWRKKSVEQLSKELEEKEMKECTFKPNTKKSKTTFQSSLGYDTRSRGGMNTPDRLSRWQEKRDLKVLRMQKEKADKVNENCTFIPNLDESKGPRRTLVVSAGTGAPTNTRRRSEMQKIYSEDRQRRASAVFYERQKRAKEESDRIKTALSPHKPLHMHPTLHSKTTAHVVANEESEVQSPIDQHLNRMAKARANREMRRNSTLVNQLRNPWSVNGSTNPDLISVGADLAPVPKDHVTRSSEKMGTKKKKKGGFRHKALRPPVMPGDYIEPPQPIPTSERISPKSVPLPRY